MLHILVFAKLADKILTKKNTDDRKKMTELDYLRWPNYIAETLDLCRNSRRTINVENLFPRTVNLDQLSLTIFTVKIFIKVYWHSIFKVYSFVKVYSPLDFGQVTKVLGLLYSVILQSQIWSSFFWSSELASKKMLS